MPLELWQCSSCGLVFLRSWGETFDEGLYDYYADRQGLSREALFDPITQLRYVELLTRFENELEGRRVLDVGCGQGHFVHTAEARGWDALGIDLSAPAIDVGRSLGAPVAQVDFFADELSDSRFDLITMFEFIEHVPKPVNFLQRAVQLLRPGGALYLTTPNFSSLDRFLMGKEYPAIHEEHLCYFTIRTMGAALAQVDGLSVVEISTRNFSPGALRNALRGLTPVTTKHREERGRPRSRNEEKASVDASLRKRAESSRLLKVGKTASNAVLRSFGLGSKMAVLARRTARA